jgi:hypothetical protein
MAKQTKAQKDTVERVMHEFKEGELKIRGNGPKVKNPKQAIAIALREAGASNQETPRENRKNLRKTKARERAGATSTRAKAGESAKSGASPKRSSAQRAPTPRERLSRQGGSAAERTRAELYAEAKRRDIPGRSRMSKGELERALR